MSAPEEGGAGQDGACKYEVVRAPGGWAVKRAGDRLAIFPGSAPAIDLACRAAREDARGGRLAIVTTQTLPQEFHCYTPPDGAAADPPSRPRLAVSR